MKSKITSERIKARMFLFLKHLALLRSEVSLKLSIDEEMGELNKQNVKYISASGLVKIAKDEAEYDGRLWAFDKVHDMLEDILFKDTIDASDSSVEDSKEITIEQSLKEDTKELEERLEHLRKQVAYYRERVDFMEEAMKRVSDLQMKEKSRKKPAKRAKPAYDSKFTHRKSGKRRLR